MHKLQTAKTKIRDTLHEMRFTKMLLRSWFELTKEEQKAVVIILALFMLGLAVRYWHLVGQKSEVRMDSVEKLSALAEGGYSSMPEERFTSKLVRNPE